MEFNPGDEAFLLVATRVKKSLYFREEEGNGLDQEGEGGRPSKLLRGTSYNLS